MRRPSRHARRCVLDRLETRALLSYGFGAPHDGVLSLTFLGDLYPVTSAGATAFLADAQRCQDALKTIEPFTSRFGQFEFHSLPLGPSLGEMVGTKHQTDYAKIDQIVSASGVTTDIAVVLVNFDWSYGTGEHQIPVLTNNYGMEGVFLHELAHSMGTSGNPADDAYNLLLDEYIYFQVPPKPHDGLTHQNIYAGDPASGAPAEWAGLVAPDEYTLGATYPNWYRTYPRSMMVDATAGYYFNAVSHQLLRQGLDYWGGPFTDLEAPKAAFAGLRDGDIVSGAVPVATTLSDNQGVAHAQLWVDGRLARNAYAAPFTLDWLTGSTAPGSHTLQVKAFDAAGNVGLSPLVQVTLVNPADITIRTPTRGSTVGSTLDTGAFHVTVDTWDEALDNVLVWVDDNTATAKRAYTAPYAVDLSTSGLAPGPHMIHAVGYAFGSGAQQLYETSIPFTFEVLAATIASPVAGQIVAAIVPVVIDVTQGHPDRIELKYLTRAGTETTLVLNQAPWVFSWDTSTAPNYTEGFSVTLYEGGGTVWLPVRIVNVANGAGSIEEPRPGATLSHTARVIWSASNKFVQRVEFRVDGNLIDSVNQNGIVVFDWDTLTATNGPHTLSIFASNTYGWSQTYNVPVTVQNSTDTGTLSLNLPPAASGLLPVSVTATGGAILKQIDVSIDGAWRGSVTQAPFTWTWDTRGLADGRHTIQVVATRASGATQTFAAELTVDNLAARFTSPASGAVVKGRQVQVALALQSGQAASVTFGVDARALKVATKAPFSLTWDSTTVPDGAHTLWAVVRNPQGGAEIAYASLTVRNDTRAPVVTLTAPAANARIAAGTTVRGRATDAGGVARVDLYLDNRLVASAVPSGANFSFFLDLSTAKKGAHRIRVAAVDRSGNLGWSAVRNIQRV